ncbi:m-AAA protease-interacting protein 1, mitochondrial-like [Betta splendens]|uniref:M-AAA protease-interacting protein 1, mitochondrial-like n=1 Tax=Betta splendens TaxID=158456 RepID=A0A6P7LI41_BETSP|nr:m-AAA protease-interacting protein 1, mitochondrial-like [Betta splendens]
MALFMLRRCCRFPSIFSITNVFLNEGMVLNRSSRIRLTPPLPVAVGAVVRACSSNQQGNEEKTMAVIVDIPNPVNWLKNRFCCFLIRTFFDKEFSIKEFTEGAKQAFSHVSRLLSKGQFDALEGLVAKELIGPMEESYNRMPLHFREALAAEPDDIMHASPKDVGIYYDDDGRRFVVVQMQFWYLTETGISENGVEGKRIFQIAIGTKNRDTKSLLTALYEFQSEFTEEVPPDWTIIKLDHSSIFKEGF